MAELVQVPGPAHILLNTGASAALQAWGFTENGAIVREEMLKLDVPGDQNGGDQGNPIEIQDLGRVGRVHLEMSKWDATVSQQVIAKSNTNGTGAVAQGVSPVPGVLIFSNTTYFRLLINPTVAGFVRNFLVAVPIEAYEMNIGTKYARFVTDWICYPPVGGGTYWNTTNT
jgi:hypothetical protein